jgi:hypothetical protein
MAKIFAEQEIGYHDPVVFSTNGGYSMDAAVEILRMLEERDDCEIRDDGWRSSGYGNLVEVGIPIRLNNIEFTIMCSYEDIFIKRLSGNKDKFYEFCELVRNMEFNAI